MIKNILEKKVIKKDSFSQNLDRSSCMVNKVAAWTVVGLVIYLNNLYQKNLQPILNPLNS